MLHITATDLQRVMNCQGSLLLPDENFEVTSDQTVRNEGDAADWIVEQVHSGKFTPLELVDRQAPNGVYITGDIIDYLDDYLTAIGQTGFVEHVTSFGDGLGKWMVDSRADHVQLDGRTLRVRDLKFGYSLVEPEMNWTLIAHAIGYALQLTDQSKFDLLRDVDVIELTIYQPRAYHPGGKIRTWPITPQQLIDLHKQIGATLANPSNLLQTGNQCRTCKKRTGCVAFLKATMNAVDFSQAAFSDNISNEGLSFMLDNIRRAAEVLKQADKAYSELATHRVKNGQRVEGYYITSDLSNLEWFGHITPDFVQIITGKNVRKETAMITPTQAKKLGISEDVMKTLAERRNKGTKLTRMTADQMAKKLFN